VQIELVAPADDGSPVQAFLAAGGGLHHLCYEVMDCERALRTVRERKGMIVRRPKPAVAFGGRKIAWAVTAEKLLIELLEAGAV
jgi:methylmalonyl-CoA/ethylmalonyl-CoA epimerase